MPDSFVVDPVRKLMAWVVCFSAGLFFFYEFFQLNVFDVINQPLRNDFRIDATQLSWMSSMFLWGNILFLLPAGVILDRYSVRWVILSAMLVCIFGTIGFALTSSFYWASFFHFLSGIGNAFSFLACVVLVSRWFPPRRQALVIGCLVTMAFIGGMMAHTPFSYLTTAYGWRRALLFDGFLGIFLLVWMFCFVKDKPATIKTSIHTNNAATSSQFFQAVKNRQNWLAGIYTCCLNLPIMVICALWGASYLQVVHHMSELASSNIISLIFLGSIVGCPLAGWLSDRSGRRKPWMILGAGFTLLTLLPLMMGWVLSETILGLLCFLLGFFTSTQVISYPFIAESNRSEQVGLATGLASIIIMGGAGVGQLLFGWLMQYHIGLLSQTYTTTDFQFAMWMFPMAAMIALLAVLLSRETYCKDGHAND